MIGTSPPPLSSISPSFTTHSSNNNLNDITARVVAEFQNEDIYDQFYEDKDKDNDEYPEEEQEEEFEFVSSDVMLTNDIMPRYPLFDQSLLLDDDVPVVVRRPLRMLFNEERETTSCSSSESDDLDGVTPGSYCVWKPKVEESPELRKKSNSTGNSSKRWSSFKKLLHRSNSDGSFSPDKIKKFENPAKVAVEPAVVGPMMDEHVDENKDVKVGNRVRSYLSFN